MPSTWQNYAQLMRAPAVFTALSNILAAHLIATEGTPEWRNLALTLLASACLYLSGMVLNDCFDLEIDRNERPHRPLPSGRIPIQRAWMLGFGLLAMGIGIAAVASPDSLLIAATLAACIVLYNSFAKNNMLGPTIMATCRYLNWLLGFSALGLNAYYLLLPLPIFAYIMGITLLSAAETQTSNRSPIFACWMMLIVSGLFLTWLMQQQTLEQPWALLPAVIGIIALSIQLARLAKNATPLHIQHTMKWLILGIIPLDAIMALAAGPPLGALAVLALLIPSRWLAKYTYVT
jgi:hypothetical protein